MKAYLILGIICISTLVGSLMVKEEALLLGLMLVLGLFFLLLLLEKDWMLKLAKVLLVPYVLVVTFLGSDELLYYLFPEAPQLYQVQNYGGTRTLVAFVLSLMFSLFFVSENRTNGERKTILIYTGGIAFCLLPSLLKQIV